LRGKGKVHDTLPGGFAKSDRPRPSQTLVARRRTRHLPGPMAPAVALEVVRVVHDHARRAAVARRPAPLGLQPLVEMTPVVQAGQAVDVDPRPLATRGDEHNTVGCQDLAERARTGGLALGQQQARAARWQARGIRDQASADEREKGSFRLVLQQGAAQRSALWPRARTRACRSGRPACEVADPVRRATLAANRPPYRPTPPRSHARQRQYRRRAHARQRRRLAAIGNAPGPSPSVSAGVISAPGRSLNPRNARLIDAVIQPA